MRFNGDTIKISADNCIVDGQHRLWATILADKPIRTAIVYGVARNAFGTVDTIRKARSGGDALALCGVEKYRRETAVALTWLKRYQDQTIESHRSPRGRVENAEIEMLIENHPDMPKAVERCGPLRNLVSPGLMAFLYYMFTSVDEELADRCLDILENPATISVNHPFFRFRSSLLLSRERKGRREPLVIIALGIKAWNFTREGREIEGLSWRNQGPTKEAFPTIT